MNKTKFLPGILAIISFLTSLSSAPLFAASEKVLYRFTGGTDGALPRAGLISDAQGNLYGTTSAGGDGNLGTIFELSPASGGIWNYTVIHTFEIIREGTIPYGGMAIDSAGNLYGTTSNGGGRDCGAVFELSPQGGTWSYKIIFSFACYASNPQGTLVFDSAGNLYGTTYSGAIYKLAPSNDGSWTYSVLYALNGTSDGCNLVSGVVFDAFGNLFGAALDCGQYNDGTLYELTPNLSGTWTFHRIVDFDGTDGAQPAGSPAFDSNGDLFGTTSTGGKFGFGTIFEAIPSKSGWTGKSIYNFTGNSDGADPEAGITFDNAGNFYGTSSVGINNFGTIFRASPTLTGGWTGEVLHQFMGAPDGALAYGNLLIDKVGNIYGVTQVGGIENQNFTYGCGTVYEIEQ